MTQFVATYNVANKAERELWVTWQVKTNVHQQSVLQHVIINNSTVKQ